MPVWRRDAESGEPLALKLTAAGLKVIAADKEPAAAIESEGRASSEAIDEFDELRRRGWRVQASWQLRAARGE